MDDMDDFGDLYVDIESEPIVYSGPNLEKLHNDSGFKRDDDPQEESISYAHSEIRGKKATDEAETITEVFVSPSPKENLDFDGCSDSEDDLHIVLNEEDCPKLPISHGIYPINGGFVEGKNIRDEEENNLVTVTETNDKKWNEQMHFSVNGQEKYSSTTGSERGKASNGSHGSHQIQYKYLRHHTASLPSNSKPVIKTEGSISVSSMLPSRGDRDVIAGNNYILPRNRPIFDVDIDKFEMKPWRHPRTDSTDYFNFGFNEKSWEHYCYQLNQLRYSTPIRGKIPVHESPRFEQVSETDFLHEHFQLDMSAIDDQLVEERCLPLGRNCDHNTAKKFKCVNATKGRALMIENGVGNRHSSIDKRRQCYRDSDVVIEIVTKDMNSNPSDSERVQDKCVTIEIDSKKEDSFVEDDEHGRNYHRGQHMIHSQRCPKHNEIQATVPEDLSIQQNDRISVFVPNLQKAQEPTVKVSIECEEDFDGEKWKSDEQDISTSSPPYDNCDEEIGTVVSLDKTVTPCTTLNKTSSLSDPTSECDQSVNSNLVKKVETEDFSINQTPCLHHNFYERKRSNVAELNISIRSKTGKNNDEGVIDERNWEYMKRSREYVKERHSEDDSNVEDGRNLHYHRETKRSTNYHETSRRLFPIEMPRWKYSTREESESYLRHSLDVKDPYYKCKVGAWAKEMNEIKPISLNRKHNVDHIFDDSHLRCHLDDRFSSDEDQKNPYLRKKLEVNYKFIEDLDDCCFQRHRHREDYIPEVDRYELSQEKHHRPLSGSSREDENLGRRDRYDHIPFFYSDDQRRCTGDVRYPKYRDHDPLYPLIDRSFHNSNYDHSWNGNYLNDAKRPPKRYLFANTRRTGDWYFSCDKDYSHTSKSTGIDFDGRIYDNDDEMSLYSNNNDRKSYHCPSKSGYWPDDEIIFSCPSRRDSYRGTSFFRTGHDNLLSRNENYKNPSPNMNTYNEWKETRKTNISKQSSAYYDEKEKHKQATVKSANPMSVHWIGSERETFGRLPRSYDTENVIYENSDQMIDEKWMNFVHSSRIEPLYRDNRLREGNRHYSLKSEMEKVSRCSSNPSSNQNKVRKFECPGDSIIEEGQIIEPEEKNKLEMKATYTNSKSNVAGSLNQFQKSSSVENVQSAKNSTISKRIYGIDKNRILETLEKMKKREERFKESIVEGSVCVKSQSDSVDKVHLVQKQRPTRKRLWGGS